MTYETPIPQYFIEAGYRIYTDLVTSLPKYPKSFYGTPKKAQNKGESQCLK